MNEVNEQQVRRLDEMDEREAHRFLTDLYSRHIPEEEYNVRHPEDYVMEMPQSTERFRGRLNMRAFQEAHPTPPSSLRVRRVLVKEGLWVVEGVIDYGGGRVFAAAPLSRAPAAARGSARGVDPRGDLARGPRRVGEARRPRHAP